MRTESSQLYGYSRERYQDKVPTLEFEGGVINDLRGFSPIQLDTSRAFTFNELIDALDYAVDVIIYDIPFEPKGRNIVMRSSITIQGQGNDQEIQEAMQSEVRARAALGQTVKNIRYLRITSKAAREQNVLPHFKTIAV